MNIHEYQAKSLLQAIGIPVPQGRIAFNKAEIDEIIEKLDMELYVIKAQIHAGGRGKAQGIKIAKSKQEARLAACSLLGTRLVTTQTSAAGQPVNCVYIEAGCQYMQEYYLCLRVDTIAAAILIMVSKNGGMNIEDIINQHPEAIYKIYTPLEAQLPQFQIRKLAAFLGFNNKPQFGEIIQKLYQYLIATDANQIEINPLVLTGAGDFVVLDAKMIFDDAALFRQLEINKLRDSKQEQPQEVQANKLGMRYIKMAGQVGCMVNGAGLAMTTMDLLNFHGTPPANFLDIGGNIDQYKVQEALKIILADPKVCAVLVNIFGGIVRCDIIAQAIVDTVKAQYHTIPLVVRLIGNQDALGRQILHDSGLALSIVETLDEAIDTITLLTRKDVSFNKCTN